MEKERLSNIVLDETLNVLSKKHKEMRQTEESDGFVHETIMGLKFFADNIKEFEKELIYDDKDLADEKLEAMKKGNISEN